MLPGPARREAEVVYHSDAGAVQDVPPPYLDRSGEASGSNAYAPAELLTNAVPVSTTPEPQSTDTKHVYSRPPEILLSPPVSSPSPAHAPSRSPPE